MYFSHFNFSCRIVLNRIKRNHKHSDFKQRTRVLHIVSEMLGPWERRVTSGVPDFSNFYQESF